MTSLIPENKTVVVRESSLPEQLTQILRNRIALGELEMGRVNINKLAEDFGVSTVPVREALRRLEAEGLVAFDGNRVVSIVHPSREELREIFLMRSALEPILLSEAVPSLAASKAVLKKLRKLVDEMYQVALGRSEWLSLNATFHQLTYSTVGLERLKRTIVPLWAASEPFLKVYGQDENAVALAQREHDALLSAIEHGDSKTAASLLATHLEGTYRTIDSQLRILDDSK